MFNKPLNDRNFNNNYILFKKLDKQQQSYSQQIKFSSYIS